MSIENLKTSDPFAEAEADTGEETKQLQSGGETDQSQGDEEPKKPQTDDKTKQPQSGEDTEESSSSDEEKKKKKSKSSEKTKKPLTKETKQPEGQAPSFENLKTFDPFAEADEDTGETKKSQEYIHIRIQQRNGRKTLTTVQGLPKKFNQKKILKHIKKQFACNGNIVEDAEMGDVIQLQGDQRKDLQEFLTRKEKNDGLELKANTIKVHGF